MNAHQFTIETVGSYAVGKTNHTRASKRIESYISLNAVDEANWREQLEDIQFAIAYDEDSNDVLDAKLAAVEAMREY